MSDYLITTDRLGIRPWQDGDIPAMARINSDPEVMKYFPSTASGQQTAEFVHRMQREYEDKGYCYFPVIVRETGEFIGFTGLLYQTYEEVTFMPCTDMGWRLAASAWGKGYATEAARACLAYGFDTLGLEKIYAMCPTVNTPSEHVMIKLGMTKMGTFDHPRLQEAPHLQPCYYYMIHKDIWHAQGL